MKKNVFTWAVLLIAVATCCAFSKTVSPQNNIRIAVLKDSFDFVVAIHGEYKIIDKATNQMLLHSRRLERSRVGAHNTGIYIGRRLYQTDHLSLESKKEVSIFVNNKKKQYRGRVDILKAKDGQLLVINVLDLETYIQGVLYHEITDKWPMEAMKAQAVAARTYAYYQMQKNHEGLFDLTSDIYSQVYGGKSAERFRTNIAVRRTRGQVLMYQGNVLPAYFHSNSGGHTEDVSELWEHDLPPLAGIVDQYAQGTPGYRWKRNYKSSDVQQKLNEKGFKIGAIKDMEVVERTKSGRVKMLKIIDRDGAQLMITGKDFRSLIGPNDIRSLLFDVEMKGYYFDLMGKGWGHGVGMCQWGAYQMAKQRFNYDEILEYYYPTAKLEKLP